MKYALLAVLLLCSLAPIHAQWSPFAAGNTDGTVIDLTWYQGDLYAGGFFTQINGDNASSVARWDGSNWQPVGGGLTDGVHNLEEIDSTLYAVRYEMQVDSNWVYALQNGSWEKVGPGFYLSGANAGQFYTPSMYDVKQYNGAIYACGEFNQNGDSTVNGIAQWNGTSWQSVGGGLSTPFFGQVIYPHQALVWDGKLFVCGNFQQAGGVTVNGVAAWDGSAWSALGDGFNSTVYGLGVYNNELYAGGDFSQSGSTALGAIAKWDGTNWVSPGFTLQFNQPNRYLFVHTVQELNNQLFVLGGFDQVTPDGQSPLSAGNILSMDGAGNLNTLAGGVDNDAESITSYMGEVLVGGFFATAGTGVSASKLALYDSLATGLTSLQDVTEIVLYPNPAAQTLALKGVDPMTKYELLNLRGSLIQSGEYEGPLSIEGLNTGLYFIRIQTDKGTHTLKFLKE